MDSLNEKENSYLKTYRDIKIFEAPDVELTEKDKLFLEEISNIKAVVEKIGEKYNNNRIFLNRTREPLSDLSLREMYKKSLDIYTEFEKNYEIQFLLKEQLPIDIFVAKGLKFFKEKLPIYSYTELCEKLVDFYILKIKNFK